MRKKLKILILEKNQTDVKVILHSLKKSHLLFVSHIVDSKKSYIKELKEFNPDLILSGDSLPKFTALDALRLVKKNKLDIPFILATDSIDNKIISKYLKAGFDDCILRSNLKSLGLSISLILERRKVFTDKKHAEEALRENEEKYRNLVERANDGIILIQDGIAKFVNMRLAEMWGGTPEEIIGNPFTNYVHPDHLTMVLDRYKRRLAGEKISPIYELKLQRKDGSTFHTEINAGLITYKDKPADFVIIRDITERKRTEEALRESEEKYRSIFENIVEGIYQTTVEGRCVIANPALSNIFGYESPEELMQTLNDLNTQFYVEPGRRTEFIRHLEEHDSIWEFESQAYRKDGSIIWILENARALREQNGKLIGCEGTITDITKLKQSENALRQNENKYRTLTENTSDWIYEVDREGKYTYSNPNSKSLLGYEPDEIIGKIIFDLMPKEEVEHQKQFFTDAVASAKVIKILENINLHKNGSQVILETNAMPILDSNGHCQGYRGIDRDITERKKSEKEIKMLAHALESVSECVSITDKNDILIYVNDAFLKTYGYTEKELIGQHISILRPLEINVESVKEILPKTIEGGWRGEIINRRKDGTEFPIILSTSVIKDDKNQPIALIGVAMDITDLKRSREELILAKEKAEKSDRLKSEFLAQMSHEIRSPLNVTLSYSNIIKEDLAEFITPEINEYFQGIESVGKRLIRTIDLILNMSELQIGSYSPIFTDIDLVEDIFQGIQSEYSNYSKIKGLEFNFLNKVQNPKIYCDRYSIYQVFSNLIDNAIKYTDKGRINITIDRNEKNDIMVSVEDTGIGMSKEFMNTMFEPFMQEESGYTKKFEGNGLGLALIKKFCDLNNAVITVESEKGKGSKFTVTFAQ